MPGGGAIRRALSQAHIKKLGALGDAQRGAPERAMLDASQYMGGGVLSGVIEHVGDLTHRMSHHAKYDTAYPDLVEPKVGMGIDRLEQPYGFVREMEENFVANAKYNDIPLEEFRAEVDMRLQRYADEHRRLRVHNRPQYFGRESAVALGEQRWDDALVNLKKLQAILDTGEFNQEALKVVHEEGFAGGGAVRSILKKVRVQLEAGNQGYYQNNRGARKVEVLVNPSQQEVERWAGREIKELRMMFDKDGNTYVWDGTESIHVPMIRELGIPFNQIADSMGDTPVHPKNYSYWVREHADEVETYNHMEGYRPPKVQVDENTRFHESVTREKSEREFAGGGSVKKGLDKLKALTRRDFLKGLGAVGTTAAAGMKAGRRQADDALSTIDEALSAGSRVIPDRDLSKPFSKDVFDKEEWNVISDWIDGYRRDYIQDREAAYRALPPDYSDNPHVAETLDDILRKDPSELLTAEEYRYFAEVIEDARADTEFPSADYPEGHPGNLLTRQHEILDNVERELYTSPVAVERWRKTAYETVPDATPAAKEAFEEVVTDGRIWDDRLEYAQDDFGGAGPPYDPDRFAPRNWGELSEAEQRQVYEMVHSEERKPGLAGGGPIRRITRRGFLKGTAAAATTAAAGMKASTKVTDPGAALKQIDEALSVPTAAWSKQDMTPRQWNTIDNYLQDKLDDILEEINYTENRMREAGQQSESGQDAIRTRKELEYEAEQIEFIRSAEPDYVFDPSSQEYLEEFIEGTVSDLNGEIYEYGDFDDINDPRVTHLREMERMVTPRRTPADLEAVSDIIEEMGDRTMGGLGPREKKAGGGKVRKALTKLKEGPAAYEEAMAAVKKGDTKSALEYLRQLQELLQLTDDEMSQMMGQGIGRYDRRASPLLTDPDLDAPIGGNRRASDSPMRKAGGGPIKGSLIKAHEWFARRSGKRLNENLEIPPGFDSFFTRTHPEGTDIVGVRPDGTEELVSRVGGLGPGADTEGLAKELAGAYNTGGFSNQPLTPMSFEEAMGGVEGGPPRADVTPIRPGDGPNIPSQTDEPNPLRSLRDVLGEMGNEMGESDLQDLLRLLEEGPNVDLSGKVVRDSAGEASRVVDVRRMSGDEIEVLQKQGVLDYETAGELYENILNLEEDFADIINDITGDWPDEIDIVPSIDKPETYQIRAHSLDTDQTRYFTFDPETGPREAPEIAESFTTKRNEFLPDAPERSKVNLEEVHDDIGNMLDDYLESEYDLDVYIDEFDLRPDPENPGAYYAEGVVIKEIDTNESVGDSRNFYLDREGNLSENGRGSTSSPASKVSEDQYNGLRGLLDDYTETSVDDYEIHPDPNRPGIFAAKAKNEKGNFGFIIDTNARDIISEGIEEVEFADWPPKPRRGYAEGGSARKEPNKALEYLRAIGRSMAGAIPGTSENFHQFGEDVGSQIYRKGALPVAGFKSQWWGVNPTSGEFEYAGPGSDALNNPYPHPSIAIHDPDEYRRQLEEWERKSQETQAIPGIIDETMLLPSLPQMIEEVYDYKTGKFEDPDYEGPAIPAPKFSLDAAERANVNWDESIRSVGLDPMTEGPEGFVENALISGGMMLGQIPLPTSLLSRLKTLIPATKSGRIDRVLRQLAEEAGDSPSMMSRIAGAGPEFFFPTIDPKTSNYIAGSLFGATLMTALSPDEEAEVEATMDPRIRLLIEQYQTGNPEEREEARRILQAIRDANTQPDGFAGGGKIRKFSRREFLRGLGATGVTAAAAGKAGMKTADDAIPALRQIDEVLDVPAAKTITPRGAPFRGVIEELIEDRKYWADDNDLDMVEMYDEDIQSYRNIADAMDSENWPAAAREYDNLDTAARERIYDLSPEDTLSARRHLGRAGSESEGLEFHELDYDERNMMIDEAQEAWDQGRDKGLQKYMDDLRIREGIEVDFDDFEEGVPGLSDFMDNRQMELRKARASTRALMEPPESAAHQTLRGWRTRKDRILKIINDRRRSTDTDLWDDSMDEWLGLMDDIEEAGFNADSWEKLYIE